MSEQPFRFLHASDLRIDEPLFGLSEISQTLVDLMIDAPYQAAERVFETAIVERVSAVLLSGSILDLRSPTPRALLFLREQFQRLADRGIAVYWAGSLRDRADRWPSAIELPESVHRFGTSIHETIGTAADRAYSVVGCSRRSNDKIGAAEFEANSDGLFTIALVAGPADAQSLAATDINYWALGGCCQRTTLFHEPHVAHYPGTSQGRNPADVGPHGCTLVDVASDHTVRSRFIPCDAVRWQNERVTISANMSSERLDVVLAERVQEMRSHTPDKPMIVTWTLVLEDESEDSAVLFRSLGKIRERLNRRFGNASERIWTESVNADERRRIPDGWYDEDTLLGDYLRAIRELRQDRDLPLLSAVPDLLTEDSELRAAATVSDSGDRARVLRQASLLGESLLRGESLNDALDRAMAGEPTDWK